MFKTARFRIRKDELEQALSPIKLENLWKKSVRTVLRDQPFNDLHDYYDFHLHIENRIKAIRTAVFEGTYQPLRPIRVKSEKKYGITRQLVVLNPEDALVFEAIGDFLMKVVEQAQPCKKAYFSRNKIQPKSVVNFDSNFGYPWWVLWPEFQEEIMDFARNRNYTVVTDVANYYDSIDFNQLRNYLASLGLISETLLDFLFFLLERFVWRPDYLPFSGRGLPQINLDAPRLVAHAFLFEIDRFLCKETNDDYVRWMDDINFGCDDFYEAEKLIGSVDDLLLSRGLRLNPSKTKILTSEEAFNYFQINENLYLNKIEDLIKIFDSQNVSPNNPKYRKIKWYFRKRYEKFIKNTPYGYWSKVFKRYFNISAKFNVDFLDPYVTDLLKNEPDLRETIFRYMKEIGWSQDREDIVIKYIQTSMDDFGFMKAIEVLIYWHPKSLVKYSLTMKKLFKTLIVKKDTTSFIGSLWLVAKFGNDNDIDHFLENTIDLWMSNDWLARQVAALWPRIRSQKTRENILNVINSFGLKSAKLVIDNYEFIGKNQEIFSKKVKYYLNALSKDDFYTLPKLLISLSVLLGTLDVNVRRGIKEDLLKIIFDPYNRNLINRIVIN